MSSIQQFLVIGGMALFSYLLLNYYKADTNQTATALYNEAIITATSIGQSIIDEIQTKSFDETTIQSTKTSPEALSSIGKEVFETSSSIKNDIDDYNNFVRKDTLSRLGVFTTKVQVYYVDLNKPNVKSPTKTFSKRIDVYITNKFLQDTLKLNHIFSY